MFEKLSLNSSKGSEQSSQSTDKWYPRETGHPLRQMVGPLLQKGGALVIHGATRPPRRKGIHVTHSNHLTVYLAGARLQRGEKNLVNLMGKMHLLEGLPLELQRPTPILRVPPPRHRSTAPVVPRPRPRRSRRCAAVAAPIVPPTAATGRTASARRVPAWPIVRR